LELRLVVLLVWLSDWP
jgi:hypothetical protein